MKYLHEQPFVHQEHDVNLYRKQSESYWEITMFYEFGFGYQ